MIHDTLLQFNQYRTLNPLFEKAFEFMQKPEFGNLDLGKYILDGDKLYVTIMEIDGKTTESAKMEAHRLYADIQVVISGTETMGWAALNQCTNPVDAYNPDKDILFYNDAATSFTTVRAGEFAVFFPEDVHAPGIGSERIRKAVFKVRL